MVILNQSRDALVNDEFTLPTDLWNLHVFGDMMKKCGAADVVGRLVLGK